MRHWENTKPTRQLPIRRPIPWSSISLSDLTKYLKMSKCRNFEDGPIPWDRYKTKYPEYRIEINGNDRVNVSKYDVCVAMVEGVYIIPKFLRDPSNQTFIINVLHELEKKDKEIADLENEIEMLEKAC